jgi:hypothetical protein
MKMKMLLPALSLLVITSTIFCASNPSKESATNSPRRYPTRSRSPKRRHTAHFATAVNPTVNVAAAPDTVPVNQQILVKSLELARALTANAITTKKTPTPKRVHFTDNIDDHDTAKRIPVPPAIVIATKIEQATQTTTPEQIRNSRRAKHFSNVFNSYLGAINPEDYKADNKIPKKTALDHQLFTNPSFEDLVQASFAILLQRQAMLAANESDEILKNSAAAQKPAFVALMNSLYKILFKKEYAGPRGEKFLCIKHKFNAKADGTAIANLDENQAITALIEIIILWEIYSTLFNNTEEKIELVYLHEKNSAQEWIDITSSAGFIQQDQFLERLKEILPIFYLQEPSEPSPLAKRVEQMATGLEDGFEAIADTVGAAWTAGKTWIENKWHKFDAQRKRNIAEELDTL